MRLPRVPQRTTTGFAFSMVDRALKEGLSTRRFGQEEIARVVEFFGHDDKKPPECVYCGSLEVKRWDHLIAITMGGETVLGNMVLSCAHCDDSRRAMQFQKWMKSDAPKSPGSRGVEDLDHRIGSIEAYVRQSGYAPRTVEQRLSPSESERLNAINSRLATIRKDIEALVADYRERTTAT